MSSPTNEPTVSHEPSSHRYTAVVDGRRSVLEYVEEKGVRVFTHTSVPEAQRGHGIAAVLVRTALEEAKREGRKVSPACSYVATFIARNPQYRGLVD